MTEVHRRVPVPQEERNLAPRIVAELKLVDESEDSLRVPIEPIDDNDSMLTVSDRAHVDHRIRIHREDVGRDRRPPRGRTQRWSNCRPSCSACAGICRTRILAGATVGIGPETRSTRLPLNSF